MFMIETQPPEVFCKKGVLRNFTTFARNHLSQGLCNFIKNKILAQVFSCKFCKIFKINFFAAQRWTTACVMITDIAIVCTCYVESTYKSEFKKLLDTHLISCIKDTITLTFLLWAFKHKTKWRCFLFFVVFFFTLFSVDICITKWTKRWISYLKWFTWLKVSKCNICSFWMAKVLLLQNFWIAILYLKMRYPCDYCEYL